MRKRRDLSDLYQFPGCKPKKTISGIFGDPRARVIKLVRQGKKQCVAFAVLLAGPFMTASPAWSATSRAATVGYISNWISGASSVYGVEQ